jgi:peptidoglycan/LPS O-acetylase OafA/YrhL
MRTNPQSPYGRIKYRPDIDGLRAIAVCLVVIFHALPELVPGGFIGVDIFFVISGFLISSTILENLQDGHFSFIEFYSRRIRRIFPALITVLLACYVFGFFILFSNEIVRLGKHVASGAGFLSNFTLWAESGYFDSRSIEKPLLHLWSLGIEEQFYIFWPLILWIGWRVRVSFFWIIFLIAAASFIWDVKLLYSNGTHVFDSAESIQAFYSPLTRFWELLVGAMTAYLLQENFLSLTLKQKIKSYVSLINFSQCNSFFSNSISTIGIFLIVLGAILIDKNSSFPGYWALLPTIGSSLFIAAGPTALFNRLLSYKFFIWIGLISFPLYLWHWPLLSFANILNAGVPRVRFRVLLVIAGIVLSWLTYVFIELPIRFGPNARQKTIALIIAMLLLGMSGFFANKAINGAQFFGWNNFIAFDLNQTEYISCKNAGILRHEVLDICHLAPNKGAPNAVIIGDSHAEDKFAGIDKIDGSRHWLVMGNSTCPPVLGVKVEGKNAPDCDLKMATILQWVVDNPEIKTVALSFFGNAILDKSFAANHINSDAPFSLSIYSPLWPNKSKVELFFEGLNSAITTIEKSGKRVVIMVDVPELPFFPLDCFRKHLTCDQLERDVMARQNAQRELLKRLAVLHPKLEVFDPINLFCKEGKCAYRTEEYILYRDSHHLSYEGSLEYGKDFIGWLDKPGQ